MTKYQADPKGFAATLRSAAERIESGAWILARCSSTDSIDPTDPESVAFVIRPRCEADGVLEPIVGSAKGTHDFWNTPGGADGYRQGFDDGRARGIELAREAIVDLERR